MAVTIAPATPPPTAPGLGKAHGATGIHHISWWRDEADTDPEGDEAAGAKQKSEYLKLFASAGFEIDAILSAARRKLARRIGSRSFSERAFGWERPRLSCMSEADYTRTRTRKNRLCHGVMDMANGQVVLVTTEGLSGGSPMRTVYYVAEEDPTKAQAIIAKIMAPNEKVEAYGLLPEAAVKALGLKPGEFRSV
jgi:predicted enzyme related to lactoylglutathione lyase